MYSKYCFVLFCTAVSYNTCLKTTDLFVHDAGPHDILLVYRPDSHRENRDGWVALLSQELHQGLEGAQGAGLHHDSLRLEVHLHEVCEVTHHLIDESKYDRTRCVRYKAKEDRTSEDKRTEKNKTQTERKGKERRKFKMKKAAKPTTIGGWCT